jgi:alkylated DNA repair dioxygenase AlkB
MIEDEFTFFDPNFIRANPTLMFDTLWTELRWERRPDAPRREYWTNIFDRDYTYGRGEGIRTYASQPTHPLIESIKRRLTTLLGFEYEACFLNGYATGKDALGWHSDDDPNINHERPIAVVTLGGQRQIDYMRKDKTEKKSIMLTNGSLFLMKAGMQDTHFHRIPRAGHVVTVPRISLTYRALR